MDDLQGFNDLVALMDRLRGDSGCPWDREQNYRSLRGYLLEECYEVIDALDREDAQGLCEELGDLLFQIVFLSRIAKEEGKFTIADVIGQITDKMIRRHPHVFGSVVAESSTEVLENWAEIKRAEKQQEAATGSTQRASVLDGIPQLLPALGKAQQLGRRAASVGFDWERTTDLLSKFEEELGELRSALTADDRPAVREELGDMLFCLAMLAQRERIDAEEALESTNRKFILRFNWIERELERRELQLEDAGLQLLDSLWDQAKGSS